MRIFEQDELEVFIHLFSSVHNQKILIIYDTHHSKIINSIFTEFSGCLVDCNSLKSEPFFESQVLNFDKIKPCSVNIKRSRAHEIVVLFYYAFLNYTYNEISEKISMDKKRISYVLTNYIRSNNLKNKNNFHLNKLDEFSIQDVA